MKERQTSILTCNLWCLWPFKSPVGSFHHIVIRWMLVIVAIKLKASAVSQPTRQAFLNGPILSASVFFQCLEIIIIPGVLFWPPLSNHYHYPIWWSDHTEITVESSWGRRMAGRTVTIWSDGWIGYDIEIDGWIDHLLLPDLEYSEVWCMRFMFMEKVRRRAHNWTITKVLEKCSQCRLYAAVCWLGVLVLVGCGPFMAGWLPFEGHKRNYMQLMRSCLTKKNEWISSGIFGRVTF